MNIKIKIINEYDETTKYKDDDIPDTVILS